MGARLQWDVDGLLWPHRAASRFIESSGQRWHVQVMGTGPALLLLHGTGASSHSWGGVVPHLAAHHTLIIPDLPGHAFSSAPPSHRLTLDSMADAVLALLDTMALQPAVVAGHSAGAAIALQMALKKPDRFTHHLSFNGALFPFKGLAGTLFPPLAKLMMWNPLLPRLFAGSASASSVKRLLTDTGSQIPEDSLACYTRLFAHSEHVGATLAMMANWDLTPLRAGFARLGGKTTLIKAMNDKLVSPSEADAAQALIRHSRLVSWQGLGHLAHEENPMLAATVIREAFHDNVSLQAVS
jgi:magnesium chelatase accessory protein